MIIDTHCHIHEPYELPVDDVLARAVESGVSKMICVGTSEESSVQAIDFALSHPEEGVFSAIGVHPHETSEGYRAIADLASGKPERLVAIGEIGLDLFYTNSPKEVQIEALKFQLEIAQRYDLPVIFHVREAFDDFWPIFDSFSGLRGVLHSFTDSAENLQEALKRGLFIGVNGISTFTKIESQKAVFDSVPLENIVFETDAPFLTPVPYRGKINEPAYVRKVLEYHAERRGLTPGELADISSRNAIKLFNLS